MDHYVDVRLLPDPEFSAPLLLSTVFGRLHRSLSAHDSRDRGEVGVSFPEVSRLHLGSVLRLHGSESVLKTLLADGWLAGLRDYSAVSPPCAVPSQVSHRTVRRVQAKSSAERLRRRLMKRHGLGAAEALQRIPNSLEQHLEHPSLQLRSASTGQHFRLFIAHGPLLPVASQGQFSSYGLSNGATVPWF